MKKTKVKGNTELARLDAEYQEKQIALKAVLLEKLQTITAGKVSSGVKDFIGVDIIPKNTPFSEVNFATIDFETINLRHHHR